MKEKWKRRLAFIGALIILLTYQIKREPELEYEITEDTPYFATYSGGRVFIDDGDSCFLLEDGDVLILDQRDLSDSNMKVVDSYKIHRYKEKMEILKILECYEECFPSKWERSIDSMQLEWTLHNLCYDFNYQRSSSTDVDFNNDDEDDYDSKILSKLLK